MLPEALISTCGSDMVVSAEDGLGALERIIAKAEVQRVDKILDIAFLEADDVSSVDAHAELDDIEKLLRTMRKQRTLLIVSALGKGTPFLPLAA